MKSIHTFDTSSGPIKHNDIDSHEIKFARISRVRLQMSPYYILSYTITQNSDGKRVSVQLYTRYQKTKQIVRGCRIVEKDGSSTAEDCSKDERRATGLEYKWFFTLE